jgi:hypothetical protein
MERDPKAKVAPDRAKEDEDARRRLDRALDEGLEETFPGSDPVNLTQPHRSPVEKRDHRARFR